MNLDSGAPERKYRMKSYLKFVMVCTLIVLVHPMPQGLDIGDSDESSEIEIGIENETTTMVTSSTSTASSSPTTMPTTTTTTTTSTMRPTFPTRSTTTARPFQPLRPNRPLASMVHSTLQTIESVVVTAGILATSLLESLMPNTPRPNPDVDKSYRSNGIPTNTQPPEFSTLDFRENEIFYNSE